MDAEPASKPLVLIVEDMEDLAFLLARALQQAGFEVECVATLAKALKRIKSHPPVNVLLLDLTLPDARPEDTVKVIPAMQEYCPVMVVSGCTHPDVIKSVEDAGAIFQPKAGEGEAFLVRIVRMVATRRRSEVQELRSNVAWLKNFLLEHGHYSQ